MKFRIGKNLSCSVDMRPWYVCQLPEGDQSRPGCVACVKNTSQLGAGRRRMRAWSKTLQLQISSMYLKIRFFIAIGRNINQSRTSPCFSDNFLSGEWQSTPEQIAPFPSHDNMLNCRYNTKAKPKSDQNSPNGYGGNGSSNIDRRPIIGVNFMLRLVHKKAHSGNTFLWK